IGSRAPFVKTCSKPCDVIFTCRFLDGIVTGCYAPREVRFPMSSTPPSLFLSAERADALSAWRSPEANVVTLRLPVDEAGAYPSTLERLLREAPVSDPALKALGMDIDRIARFVRGEFVPGPRRGLCVVSCAKYGVFETFASPEPITASLTASARAELSPLYA